MMNKSWFWLAAIMILATVGCKGQTDKPKVIPEQATRYLTKADFLKLIVDYEKDTATWVFKGEKPCVVDFYADWCAPCHVASPILEDLAKQYKGQVDFYKVNIDKEQELSAVFGIQSIPAFLFCPLRGNPTLSSGIANSPEATKKMFIQQIEELLLKTESSAI